MNPRQQKQYDKINLFLSQFEAKIKDGEEYTHSEENITIINKYSIERNLRADSIKRLSGTIDFWTFDGIMSDRQKNQLDILRNIAINKKGIVVSTIYKDGETKLEFEDKDKNRFWMMPTDVKQGSWSPYEAKRVYNNPEYHLKELKAIAESKGGKLISNEYKDSKNKLEFEDKLGNRFFMDSSHAKKGIWSPYESGSVRDPNYHIAELEKIAIQKGGKLISNKYQNAHSKLEFEDKDKNRFFMAPTDVKSGKWSPYESGNVYNNPEYHLNILKTIAKEKGGKLISNEYKNGSTKMEFEDKNGNRFFMRPNSVKMGQWSPFEIFNLSEERCRQCIEFIFETKFLNTWDIIKRQGKRNLQLDGYNDNLKLAFEYQGEQHYHYKDVIAKTEKEKKEQFELIQKNDHEKRQLCEQNNIVLIEIKYFNMKYKNDIDYLTHVIKEIEKYNNLEINQYLLNIEDRVHDFKIDYNKMPTNQKYLDELKNIAEHKGGKLISTEYINNSTNLEFEDRNGNRFLMRPANVKLGRWSPYEVKKVRDSRYHLNELKLIAENNGGKLISNKYTNNKTKLEFEDKSGNRFFMDSSSVKSGSWSPYESGNVRNPEFHLNKLRTIAQEKGGKLISDKYINNSTKLEFEDKFGNRFFISPNKVKSGQWNLNSLR